MGINDVFDVKSWTNKEVNAQEIIYAANQRDPFFQFQGASANNIILLEPEGSKVGTKTKFEVLKPLSGAGVRGNEDMALNYDKMDYESVYIDGEIIGNSVRSPVAKLIDRTKADFWRTGAKVSLTNWLTTLMVRKKFYEFSKDLTNIVYGDNVTKADYDSTQKFSTVTLDEMIKRAKNGYIDPVTNIQHYPLIPYLMQEKTEMGMKVIGEFYPVFIGSANMEALNNDPIFKAEQNAKAMAGVYNSLSGFAGTYKNAVIIEVSTDSPVRAGAVQSNVNMENNFVAKAENSESMAFNSEYTPIAERGNLVYNFKKYNTSDNKGTEIALLLGCGAGALPFDVDPTYMEHTNADEGRKIVAYIDMYFGFGKIKLTHKDNTQYDNAVIAGFGAV